MEYDPQEEAKRAFDRTLDGWEGMAKGHLRRLDTRQLQHIFFSCHQLAQWAQEVYCEEVPHP